MSMGGAQPGVIKDVPRSSLVLLQSLRAVAAGMIVVYHIYLLGIRYMIGQSWLPRATTCCEAGVDLFFVISGFIMMHITPRAFRSWPDQLSFLFRRFGRIYPAYWAVALPLLVIWYHFPTLFNTFAGHRVDVTASLFLTPPHDPPVLAISWSLTCELFFYVVASLIFYGGEGFRFRAALIWGLAIVGLNLIWQNKVRSPWMISVIQPMTLEFIGGMLLAYFFRKGVGRISPRTAALATLLSVATVIAWASHHGSYFFARDPLTRPLFYGGPALVVVWMALQMDLQGQWRGLAALASAGDRSYTTPT
jgi:peptidoglycan/LPS O-acetylase OafA/YrhL